MFGGGFYKSNAIAWIETVLMRRKIDDDGLILREIYSGVVHLLWGGIHATHAAQAL